MTEVLGLDLEQFAKEVIRERSLTMEDGRERGVASVSSPLPVEKKDGGDDGDSLD